MIEKVFMDSKIEWRIIYWAKGERRRGRGRRKHTRHFKWKWRKAKLILSRNCNWYNISATVKIVFETQKRFCLRSDKFFIYIVQMYLYKIQFVKGLDRLFWFMMIEMTHENFGCYFSINNYISIRGFLNNNFISSNHWMLNESNKNNQSSVHDFVI